MQLLNAMLSRFIRIGTLRIIDAEGCALASVAKLSANMAAANAAVSEAHQHPDTKVQLRTIRARHLQSRSTSLFNEGRLCGRVPVLLLQLLYHQPLCALPAIDDDGQPYIRNAKAEESEQSRHVTQMIRHWPDLITRFRLSRVRIRTGGAR